MVCASLPCTHDHAAAGLETPQGVFRVYLVSEFSLHQRFLLGPIPHTHFDAAGLHADTDLRTTRRERGGCEIEVQVTKEVVKTAVCECVFTWRPLRTALDTNTRTSTSM